MRITYLSRLPIAAMILSVWLSQRISVQGFVPSQSGMRIGTFPSSIHNPSYRVVSRHRASIEEDKATSANGEEEPEKTDRKIPFYKLPRAAYRIYKSYFKRLWRETDVENRHRIANDKVRNAIRSMQQVLQEEYADFTPGSQMTARETLFDACDKMLESLPKDKTDDLIV